MKTRWKEINYNEELDCGVVFWGENSGYKMRCGEWFDLHLGNVNSFLCLKLGRDWYIFTGRNDIRIYLKENEIYQVDL